MGVAARERRSRRVPWGPVVAVLAVLLALWATPGFLDRLIPDFPNPFAEETVDRSRPALLRSIRDLSELHAASGHFEVVVDLERDTALPSEVLGERTLFVAVGDVDAIVDLGAVEERNVTVSDDRRSATIVLPPPRLGEPTIDVANSYVYSRQRGVLNRIGSVFGEDADAQREVYVVAQREIREAAQSGSGLVPRAERNAEEMLVGLLRTLGFERVDVRFDEAL
jgi:hypothetical protein